MKIHMRPLPTMSLATPPKPPPTAFQLEIQTEQLIKTAQKQQTRLKKLYGAHKNRRDLDKAVSYTHLTLPTNREV